MKKMIMWSMVILLMASISAPLSVVHAQSKHQISFCTIAAAYAPPATIMEKMKAQLEKESDGAIEMRLFPAGQLGNESAMLNSLRTGVVQTAAITAVAISTIEPLANVLMMPFVIKDWDDVEKFAASETLKAIGDSLDKKGLKLMGIGSYGFFNILSVKNPVRTTGDLRGLKIRVYPTPPLVDLYRTLGASPTPIAFPEIYTALQQGVIDATDGTLDSSYTSKQYEVAKYLTKTDHIHGWFLYLVNKAWFNRLPENVKAMLEKNFETHCALQRQEQQHYEAQIQDTYIANGMEIVELSEQERANLRSAAKPMHEEHIKKLGESFVNRFYQEIGYK